MRLVAYDPGESTGYVVCEVENYELSVLEAGTFKWLPREKLAWELARQIRGVDVVVYESYTILPAQYKYNHQGDKGIPLQVIGMIQAFAYLYGKAELVDQPPTQKAAGYAWMRAKPIRTEARHALDAKAHAMFYLVTKNLVRLGVDTGISHS